MSTRQESVQTRDGVRRPEMQADRRPETKTFLASSEFWVAVAGVAAMLFAAYVLKDLGKNTSWKYVAWIGIAYIVSRGLAKAGSQRQYDRYVDYDGASGRRSD
jgi:hypothetical protein